jgi:hypothetical protein
MSFSTINDPGLIEQALDLRQCGMLVPDIAKQLSRDTGVKITQMSLCRLFVDWQKVSKSKEISESDYPSRDDIENTFSILLQKEKNMICQYGNETLRRSLMIKFLNAFWNKEFTYNDARIQLNDRDNGNNFFQHFKYLENNNFIEKVGNEKFKFCDRVKKWKTFNKL